MGIQYCTKIRFSPNHPTSAPTVIATPVVERDCREVLAQSERALVVLQGEAADVAASAALASYRGFDRMGRPRKNGSALAR